MTTPSKILQIMQELSPSDLASVESGLANLKSTRAADAKKHLEAAQAVLDDAARKHLIDDIGDQARRMTALVTNARGRVQAAASAPVKVAPQASTANGPKPVQAKRSRRAKPTKGVIRFRDPANPKNEWTGRGTQPKWIRGKDRAQFAVAPGAQTGA